MANKIIIHRTHIAIHDYSIGDNSYLERSLSIWDKRTHKLIPKAYYYDYKNRILKVPRGVDINKLEQTFGNISIVDYSSYPFRKLENEIHLKYTPRDDDQKEAIKFILAMDKYHDNRYKTMLSLNLNTGKGKTYCAIASMCYMNIASIIITNSNDVLEQWHKFFLNYTDIDPNRIFFMSGSPNIHKLLNRPAEDYDIYLCTHSTLNSYASTNGWDSVGELFKYLGIGLKFYDECHMNFVNMFLIDCHTNCFMSYYLTATMGRSNFDEDQIFKIYFNGTPSIDLFNKDEDPHTRYVAIKYNSKPSPLDIDYCRNAYGLDRNKYVDYVINQPNFEKILYILMEKALAKPGKCLWYIGTNDAILKVRDWIYAHYPEMIGNVGIFTSIVDPSIKAQQLERKIILSTTKSAGAAMDIQGLVETVNLAEPFKSKVLAQQTLGRTRASDTIYKDIVDLGFDTTRRFYNAKKPIFKKYATTCSDVILNDDELNKAANKIIERRRNIRIPVVFEDNCKIQKT